MHSQIIKGSFKQENDSQVRLGLLSIKTAVARQGTEPAYTSEEHHPSVDVFRVTHIYACVYSRLS
jgi:hypothetical protein